MYKRPKKNCEICNGSGFTLIQHEDFDVWYDRYRCSCSERLTKRYKKHLKKSKKLKKFFDNNVKCNTDIVDTSRSW